MLNTFNFHFTLLTLHYNKSSMYLLSQLPSSIFAERYFIILYCNAYYLIILYDNFERSYFAC